MNLEKMLVFMAVIWKRYENGREMPNADTIIRIVEVVNASFDYLLLNGLKEGATTSAILRDRNLIRKFKIIVTMSEDDKHVIVSLIDPYIKKQQIKGVIKQ